MVELPRHVKKPGGLWLRVNTPEELAAALADGWALRLPAPGADQPVSVEPAVAPPPVAEAKAKRGRPRKVTTDDHA